jgi:protein O-GlcNAc transferase
MSMRDTLGVMSHPQDNVVVREAYGLLMQGRGGTPAAKQMLAQAEGMLLEVHGRSPQRLDAVQMLAMVRQASGDLAGAAAWLKKGIALQPGNPEPATNYIRLLRQTADDASFARELAEMLEKHPLHAELAALGYTLDPLDKGSDAHFERLERAIGADHARAWQSVFVSSTWCKALCSVGQHREAERWMMRASELDQHNPQTASTNLFFACAWSHWTPQKLFEAHAEVGRRLARAGKPSLPSLKVSPGGSPVVWPDRRLRIGYITADAKKHSVAYFMHALFAHHDREKFAVNMYMNVKRGAGDVTEMLTQHCAVVRSVVGQHEVTVGQQIIEDEVDVLVDLGGFTSGSGVWLLRHRLAPTQLTYLGYPHSTGFGTIDGRVVDAITDPVGSEGQASERLVRVPGCFVCYSTLGAQPPKREKVESGLDRPVTFGSFNALHKYSEKTVELWARVLKRVPGSRLVCKTADLGMARRRAALADAFARLGIGAERLELLGKVESTAEHLRLYSRIDVALDTMPYNGTTTTVEALLMGTPVVTMLGDRHASRVSASLLTAAEAPELVAESEEGFVEKAAELAGDRARLVEYQTKLPQQVVLGQLGDGAGFMKRFERAVMEFHARAR